MKSLSSYYQNNHQKQKELHFTKAKHTAECLGKTLRLNSNRIGLMRGFHSVWTTVIQEEAFYDARYGQLGAYGNFVFLGQIQADDETWKHIIQEAINSTQWRPIHLVITI